MFRQLEFIRQQLHRWTSAHIQAPVDFSESILIRDNKYCGHRFRSDEVVATWKISQDFFEITVDGRVVESIRLPTAGGDTRAA